VVVVGGGTVVVGDWVVGDGMVGDASVVAGVRGTGRVVTAASPG
jgi:hypothetical protein